MALSALNVEWAHSISATMNRALDLSTPTLAIAASKTMSFSLTGTPQADRFYGERIFAQPTWGAFIDLQNVQDQFGEIWGFDRIRGLYIENLSTEHTIEIASAGAATLWGDGTDKLLLPPEGYWAYGTSGDGIQVTSDNAQITFNHAGAVNVPVKIIVIGTEA